jgi:hypothetical protein
MYEILLVIALSSFEIYAAIATGLAFGLSSHILCLSTLTGGIAGVFISLFLGDKIRALIAKYRKPQEKKESRSRAILNQLWSKYGNFGVGFLGSLIVGAPISIGVAVGFGVQIKQLVWYCLAAVILRSIVFSYFFVYLKSLF